MKKSTISLVQSLLLSAALALGMTSGAEAAGSQMIVPMLACPLGCGIVQTDTLLAAQMARANAKVLPAAQETPGFMYNVRAMAQKKRWKNTIFGTEDTVIQAAFQGGRPELKKFVPHKIPIKFKLLYGEGIVAQGKFYVTLNPNIKSIADLKGKRISIGLPTQSDWGMSAELLLRYGYGITPQNTSIRHVTPAVMTQQLIDGNTDAALVALITNSDQKVWWTNDLTSKLAASGKQIHYLPVSKKAIAAVNKKFGMTLLDVDVPAGTLPDQKTAFLAGGNRIYEAVHPDFPDHAAYELVKAVAKFGPELKKTKEGLWKFWSPANMVAGLSDENVAPGAKKAYQELGWWKLRHKFPPVTYPHQK